MDQTITGATPVLDVRSGMSDEAVRLTVQLESLILDDDRNNKAARRVAMNSYSMSDRSYCLWLSDMIQHYPSVSGMVKFDYRAGASYLCSLIQGLDSIRRRIHGMTVDQEASLLLGSFVLLKSDSRQRQKYFYLGADEVALKDEHLVNALISVPLEMREETLERLSQLVGGASGFRPAEVEAALSGSQANALVEGAL